jgi:hypothetical protein
MEASIFLAQLVGLTMLIISVIVFFQPTLVERIIKDLHFSPMTLLLSGFMSLVIGLAIVLTHNIWEFNWRGLITLFGWIAIIKGVGLLAWPDSLNQTAKFALKGHKRELVLGLLLIASLYLVSNGFSLL